MRLSTLNSMLLMLVSVVVMTPVSTVSAQSVTLRCGGGTVQTGGFTINALGEVVFQEMSIACNVQQNPGLPEALVLSITAPPIGATVDVSNGPQNVAFSGLITNYSAAIDVCHLKVNAPSGAPAMPDIALTPNGAGEVSTSVPLATGIPGGNYTLRLSCTRTANNQQIVVAPVDRVLAVVSGPGAPVGCAATPVPAVFAASPATSLNNYTDAHNSSSACFLPGNGGFGAAPNVAICARHWTLVNQINNGTLQHAQLRSWKFRPTANTRMKLWRGNGGSGANTVSISECPGQFSQAGATPCQRQNSDVYWSTKAGDTGYCQLDPNKDYYLNAASFDLNHFRDTGVYRPVQTCAGGCQTEAIWKVQPDIVP